MGTLFQRVLPDEKRGPMLYGKVFIDQNPNATPAEILDALSGLLCRCHTHTRMVRALARYAEETA